MNTISAKINLGKIAYESSRKSNAVDITIELRTKNGLQDYETLNWIEEGIELSICGAIWDAKHYDHLCGGQCLDEIAEYITTDDYKRIVSIWKEYHLNDLTAGTKNQTETIKQWELDGNKYDYTEVCNYLKSINLYEDRGYKYGSAWLFKPIPNEIIEDLKSLIQKMS